MTGVAFDSLAQKDSTLIRRAIDGSVFMAPFSADAITSLTDTDKLLKALPSGYEDVGLLDDAGVTMPRSVDTANVTSYGRVEPSRTDVTKDTKTIKLVAQETKALTIGLYTGADMSGITADATSGEVQIAIPARPTIRFYRCLVLAVDLSDDGEIYDGRFYPRVSVTDYDDEKHQSSGDDPTTRGVTLTAYVDDVLGYSMKELHGGQGWAVLNSAMGF
jgi:hypothetical protein